MNECKLKVLKEEDLKLKLTVRNGVITDNFEEVYQILTDYISTYSVIQYDDDAATAVKQMRADRATLNKAKTIFAEKKASFKKDVLKPFTDNVYKFQRLDDLVDTQLPKIDEKIKDFEQKGRNAKKTEIRTFYDGLFSRPDDFKEELFKKVYDSSWENASATKKAYKDALTAAVTNYQLGAVTIQALKSDFEEQGIDKFKNTLDVTKAIEVMNHLHEQKESLLKKERESLEREKIRIEEAAKQKIASEVKKKEEELQRQNEENKKKEQDRIDSLIKALEERTNPPVPSTESVEAASLPVTPSMSASATEKKVDLSNGFSVNTSYDDSFMGGITDSAFETEQSKQNVPASEPKTWLNPVATKRLTDNNGHLLEGKPCKQFCFSAKFVSEALIKLSCYEQCEEKIENEIQRMKECPMNDSEGYILETMQKLLSWMH